MKPKIPEYDYLAIPLSPDDLIQIETVAVSFPISIEIEGTALDSTGNLVPFRFIQDITSSLTVLSQQFRLGYQALLSIVAHTRTASIPDGDCYSRLTLIKSFTNSVFPHRKLLAEGYISTVASIGYGSPSINGAPSDHFFSTLIEVASPVAGANFEFVVPGFTFLKIYCISFLYTSSADVTSRTPAIRYVLPSAQPLIFAGNTFNVASEAITYMYYQFPLLATINNPKIKNQSIPILNANPGTTINSLINNIQSADTVTEISILALRKTIPF